MRIEPTNVEHEVKSVDLIVSKSDREGIITYVNPIFVQISGYSQNTLLNQPHSILRHPDMPKVIFRYLWKNLNEGNDVVIFIKNLCADGGYYWTLATIKIAKSSDGSFRNYMSIRRCITEDAKETISNLYSYWLKIEKSEGESASQEIFESFLQENGLTSSSSFNDYMKKLS